MLPSRQTWRSPMRYPPAITLPALAELLTTWCHNPRIGSKGECPPVVQCMWDARYGEGTPEGDLPPGQVRGRQDVECPEPTDEPEGRDERMQDSPEHGRQQCRYDDATAEGVKDRQRECHYKGLDHRRKHNRAEVTSRNLPAVATSRTRSMPAFSNHARFRFLPNRK
jgi:hypothetical protein